MSEEIFEIQNLPEGLFRLHYKKLSLRTIRNLRTRYENKILELIRKQNNLHNQIENMNNNILQLEKQLTVLKSWSLENDEEYKKEHKAQEFLKEIIGNEAFNQLRQERELIFKANDERIYKIDIQGNIFRRTRGTNSYRKLCIIKPKLPISDVIACVLTSVKEHPENYRNYARR